MTDPRIVDLQQQVDALTVAIANEKRRSNQAVLEAEAGMAELIRQTAVDSRSAGRDEAAREIWAAIRKAVGEPMRLTAADLPYAFTREYIQGRREAVDLIRDLAEAALRAQALP